MFAVAAVALMPPGTTLRSTYTLRWLAVALMLVAAAGRRDRRAAVAAAIIAAVGGLYIAGDSLVTVARTGNAARLCYVAGGLLVAAISASRLARRSRAFDPVTMVAVQLATGLAAYWLYYAISGLGLNAHSYLPESAWRTAGVELGLLALAFAGIGTGLYRTWRPAAERLGWRNPEPWHLALAIVVALLLALSNVPLNMLMSWLMPGSETAVAKVSQHVFSGVPAWNLPLIAVLAGIGEETLFRGALQPRFGILITAALFALIHIQYGPTLILVWVFGHGLVYGLVRRHINTTAAIVAHASYDFSAFLNGPGFAVFCLIGFALLVYLLRLAARDPERVRDGFRRAFRPA
ncbi:MAG TPA: CPBP family intramembrane glutamic endopeptidase [Candidatus Udaeobacter sp.]|nr:CPBP family intramembrane glutamic endopeptidase [Candidatus Udaeobacter sp.]